MALSPTSSGRSGGAGGAAVLFSQTLLADTASIDTGAAGIAAGYSVLEAWMLVQLDSAAGVGTFDITLNNDSSAIYDSQSLYGFTATAAAAALAAQTKWSIPAHDTGGTSGYATVVRLTIPGYASTVFNKVAELTEATIDATSGNNRAMAWALGYRSTAAVSRLKIAGQGAVKFKAGSQLIILGR